MRGEGYEPVHTSTIERFYRCFYQLNRFIIHRVERVHYAGFTDRREKGLDGVKQNPVEMAGSEETAHLTERKLVLLNIINKNIAYIAIKIHYFEFMFGVLLLSSQPSPPL